MTFYGFFYNLTIRTLTLEYGKRVIRMDRKERKEREEKERKRKILISRVRKESEGQSLSEIKQLEKDKARIREGAAISFVFQ